MIVGVDGTESDGLFHRDILQHGRVSLAGRAAVYANIRRAKLEVCGENVRCDCGNGFPQPLMRFLLIISKTECDLIHATSGLTFVFAVC